MESMSERERYLTNPLRLIHGLTDLAIRSLRVVDNAPYVFDERRPYNEVNYPPIINTEAPVEREELL